MARSLSGPSAGQRGFTLIELVVVVVIMGIIAAVAFQSGRDVYDAAKVEQTKQELNNLAVAMAGNPDLLNNGIRSDFGYVGDVGALPPNLSALRSNPGGYGTWKGPYIENRFSQITDDYREDAWGVPYSYVGGTTITSTGSGGTIVRTLAGSVDELLSNRVNGNVYDLDGTPPGWVYRDSVTVQIDIPDGYGNVVTKTSAPNAGGLFTFDSIPIGNHGIRVIYEPTHDTLARFVSVVPRSSLFAEYRLAADIWKATGTGELRKIDGSDSLQSDCRGFYFWIENTTGAAVVISSITVSWSSPEGYYRYVVWDGTVVFDHNNPKNGSGDVATFTTPQTITEGDSLRIDVDDFRGHVTGGSWVDMDHSTFTVTLSNGTSFDVSTGACP